MSSNAKSQEVKTGKPSNSQATNVSNKFVQLAKSSQLYWFSAHVASIVSFVLWQILGLFSRKQAFKFSRLALVFQLASYGIVIWKSVPLKKTTNKIQLLRNENVQYFAFAAVLLITSAGLDPWTKAVSPFIIYSFFHSITYFQKTLLGYIPVSMHVQAQISDRITYITSNLNLQALFFASVSELMLLLDIALGVPGLIFSIFRYPTYVLFFSLRAVAVIIFLKLRYDESHYTRQAVQQLDGRITGILSHPMAPPQISALYYGPVRTTITKYANYVSIPKIASAKKTQ